MKNLLLVYLFSSLMGYAQNKPTLKDSIAVKADYITTDKQNNLYVVTANELSKYNKDGKLLYKYSNKTLGNIDWVDVSNWLKPVLFYKNFLQVVYLDNTLSANGEPVSLDNAGYPQAQFIAASFNNSIWLYDQQNMELVRINQNLEKVVSTGNLSVLLHVDLKPISVVEYDNKVYLNNPLSGILVFDIYGTYYKSVPFRNVQHFQVIGDWVYCMTADNKIQAYNLKTTETVPFDIPLLSFVNFRVENDVLFVQTKTAVYLYNRNK